MPYTNEQKTLIQTELDKIRNIDLTELLNYTKAGRLTLDCVTDQGLDYVNALYKLVGDVWAAGYDAGKLPLDGIIQKEKYESLQTLRRVIRRDNNHKGRDLG